MYCVQDQFVQNSNQSLAIRAINLLTNDTLWLNRSLVISNGAEALFQGLRTPEAAQWCAETLIENLRYPKMRILRENLQEHREHG